MSRPSDDIRTGSTRDGAEPIEPTTGRVADDRRRGLIALLLVTMVMTLDLGVLWLATPSLSADLRPTNAEVLWINDAYGLVIASTLVLMGNLGDRWGRRRTLLGGVVIFVAASLLAAWSQSTEMLIAARALLGLAGAAIMPATLALVNELYPERRARARAIGWWVTALSTGIAIGPVIGGLLVERFWWGSVFLVGVPLMLPMLGLARRTLPQSRSADAPRLDGWSVPLLLMTTVPGVLAVKSVGEHGFISMRTLLPLGLAVVAGVALVRRQRRVCEPLLDLGLLAVPPMRAAVGLLVLGLMAMNGVEYLVPQLLQLVHGVSASQAGLLMVIPAAGLALGSQLTSRSVTRFGESRTVALGACLALASLVSLAILPATESPAWLAITTAAMMAGLAPVTVVGTGLAVSVAPQGRSGQAAGIGQTAYEMGLALGIAVIGSAAASVYSRRVHALAPDGADPAVVDQLSQGFASIPVDAVGAVVDSARLALTDGFRVAAALSAVACLVMLVLLRVVNRALASPQERSTASAIAARRGDDRASTRSAAPRPHRTAPRRLRAAGHDRQELC